MASEDYNGVQKAAILLIALGPEKSASIFKHLKEEEILSVEITNPVILGEAVHDKEIRLDISLKLNNKSVINLEMQIANKLNWTNRSLLYLSRSFDNLHHGQDYLDIHSAIHIGFLDYTLFPEHPEFYATYQLLNVKDYTLYSDKLRLSVLDLTHIDMATEEDKFYQIDFRNETSSCMGQEERIYRH